MMGRTHRMLIWRKHDRDSSPAAANMIVRMPMFDGAAAPLGSVGAEPDLFH
jgi:hypothetical protein